MKKFRITPVLVVILLFFLIIRCDKDDKTEGSPQETTVEQDKQSIENSMDGILDCMTMLKNGNAAISVKTFLKMSGGEALSEDWVQDLIDKLDVHFNWQQIEENGRFDFANLAGIYSWDINAFIWNYSQVSGNNKIVLQFPSNENETNLNAVLTLHSYTDEYLNFSSDSYWFPQSLYANLVVDQNEIAWVNLSNVEYDGGSFQIPISANIEVFTKPFTYNINYIRETPTRFHFIVGYTNGGGCVMNINAEFQITHSDYENLDLEDDLNFIEATIQHGNLKFTGSADMGTLLQMDDPTPSQVNQLVNVDVYYMGFKIGDLEYKEFGDEEEVYIVYKDGSSENTSRYYEDFLDGLELIVYDFTGEWDKK